MSHPGDDEYVAEESAAASADRPGAETPRTTGAGKGTLDQMLSGSAFVLSGYAVQVSMVYLLDPVSYGIFGIMIAMTNLARVLLSNGLPQATSRFIAHSPREAAYPWLRTSMRLQWLLGAIVVLVYVGGTPLWTRLLNDPGLTPYFWVSAPLIPLLGAFQVLQSYFNGTHRFRVQAWMQWIYSVGRVVFAVLLVLLGFSVFGLLVGFALSLVVAIAVSYGLAKPRDKGPDPGSRTLLAFALPLMLLAVGQSVLTNLDLLVLKHYFPDSPNVGYYSGAMAIGRSPYFVLIAFSAVLLPVVSKALGEDDLPGAGRAVSKNITFLLVTALPVIAVVAALPREILDFVYPAAYSSAAVALVWQSSAQALLALIAALTAALTAQGRSYVSMAVWLACIPVQLVASLMLVPRLGMAGTGLASFIAAATGVVIAGALVYRGFGRPFEAVRLLKAAAAALVVYLLLSVPSTYPLVALPFVCVAAVAAYGAILYVMGGIDRSEIASLLSRKRP